MNTLPFEFAHLPLKLTADHTGWRHWRLDYMLRSADGAIFTGTFKAGTGYGLEFADAEDYANEVLTSLAGDIRTVTEDFTSEPTFESVVAEAVYLDVPVTDAIESAKKTMEFVEWYNLLTSDEANALNEYAEEEV